MREHIKIDKPRASKHQLVDATRSLIAQTRSDRTQLTHQGCHRPNHHHHQQPQTAYAPIQLHAQACLCYWRSREYPPTLNSAKEDNETETLATDKRARLTSVTARRSTSATSSCRPSVRPTGHPRSSRPPRVSRSFASKCFGRHGNSHT